MLGALAAVAGLGAIGSYFGAKEQGNAARDAAKISTGATDRATQLQREMFDKQVELQTPWRDAGVSALNRLQQMNEPGYNFQADPGYQFRLSQGTQALTNRATATGGARSGNTLKALMEYGQNLGSQEYTNQYNRLAGLAGVGQAATNQTGGAAGAYGQNVGNLMMQNATNAGNAALAAGQARGSMYQGLGNLGGNALAMYSLRPQNSFGAGQYAGGGGYYTGMGAEIDYPGGIIV
jgi:hypothetical protein